MITLKPAHISRLANVFLRLVTLAAKLGLTLYMGRYLNLADIGAYGLAFGAIMIMTAVLGIRLDYFVSRDIVGAPAPTVLVKMRDQAVFYGYNFLVLAVAMLALTFTDVINITHDMMLIIFVLSVVESIANVTYININSLGHPVLANVLFFIRSGLWALLVTGAGLLFPSLRNADAILTAWIFGSAASLVLTLWAGRHLPGREALKTPVDWAWVKHGVTACFFIWLGALGSTAGFYVDRFVVAENLNLDMAGVVTFYSSFTVALITLVQSGVLAFAYPRLITFYREKNMDEFWHEARKSAWHVAIFAGLVAIAVGIGVPLLGHFFHRHLLAQEAPTLWLMLLGTWLKSNAFTLYYILFARHQDRAIWLGDLLYLIPSLCLNIVLVPLIGFVGIGYSTLVTNVFLLAWRLWYVKIGTEKRAIA